MVLLTDADTTGARAFVGRLCQRVLDLMNQEPSVWIRSFPDLEEATEAEASAIKPTNGKKPHRRASDNSGESNPVQFQYAPDAQPAPRHREAAKKPDPRESYIDFLERM